MVPITEEVVSELCAVSIDNHDDKGVGLGGDAGVGNSFLVGSGMVLPHGASFLLVLKL